MDAVSATRDFPMIPLLGRAVQKPGVPHQGYSNGPPIHQRDREGVCRKKNAGNALVSFECQNAHSKPL